MALNSIRPVVLGRYLQFCDFAYNLRKSTISRYSEDWHANLVWEKVKIAQIVLEIMGRHAPDLKASTEGPKDLVLPAAG